MNKQEKVSGVFAENDRFKFFQSPDYNSAFDKKTGEFLRWGKTEETEDDPDFCKFGPEILDLEVSEICHGINGKPCPFCYKSNTGNKGRNMSFETFKTIIDKFPKILTQVAFGIGDLNSNPDLFKMFEYCREIGVIPNLTINGWDLTDESAKRLSELCGAVAVSVYDPKDVCYDAVKKLTDLGMTQINVHCMVSDETYERCLQMIEDKLHDPRLEKLNAIVFLMLKKRGRGIGFTKLSSLEKYKRLVDLAFEKGVAIGFDSCSASSFTRTITERFDFEKICQMVDSCESTLFSSYINVEGKFFSCSFCENQEGTEWTDGIDVVNCKDFIKDVWNHPKTIAFRKKLIASKDENGCRRCPVFDVELCLEECVQ